MRSALLSPRHKLLIFVLLMLLGLHVNIYAQLTYRSTSSSLTVSGTSTLHDWKETSAKGTANAVFTVAGDKLTGLSLLHFTVPVKSLRSENKSMDNNTYKALKANQHPDIRYTLLSATVSPVGATAYAVRTRGRLTIAGATRETDVLGTAKVNADNSITVSGSKKLKMTDYGVAPPRVMMVKTGNDVTISYNLKLTR